MFHISDWSGMTARNACDVTTLCAMPDGLRMVKDAPRALVARFATADLATDAARMAGVKQSVALEPLLEHKARLAGEASYLAGECCTLAACEARCADLLDQASRYPSHGFQIFASFAAGFNGMGECLASNGFALELAA